jgi:PilZ domain
MSGKSGQDRVERRAADRVSDTSLLVVSGVRRTGEAFQESTRIKNVSAGGISFPLKTPIEAGDLLNLSICSEQGLGSKCELKCQITARALRVCPDIDGTGNYIVAACFEGEIVSLTGDYNYDALIRELQQAVEYDESRRHQFE